MGMQIVLIPSAQYWDVCASSHFCQQWNTTIKTAVILNFVYSFPTVLLDSFVWANAINDTILNLRNKSQVFN